MIVILGNTNDEKGTLSAIAKARCNKAIELWKDDPKQEIITTGTFGGHFNITTTSHSDYLKKYLTDGGKNKIANVDPKNILPNIVSTNTFQDILGLREVLREKSVTSVDIITSDYHYGRVKFYCDLILHDQKDILPQLEKFNIISTTSKMTAEAKAKLVMYEKGRMEKIMTFPAESYVNATAEQKHYDNVSNWMISGQFVTFALGYKYIREIFDTTVVSQWQELPLFYKVFMVKVYWEKIFWEKLLYVITIFLVITLFWELYKRAAHTARTARRTLKNIERCYSQFGFSVYYLSGSLKDRFFTHKRMLECIYLLTCMMLLYEISSYLSATFVLIYFAAIFKIKDPHKL